jgi:hypothetical protein
MARGAHLAADVVRRGRADSSWCRRVCGRRWHGCDKTRGWRWRESLAGAKRDIQPEATEHEYHASGKPLAVACHQAKNGRALRCTGDGRRYRTPRAVGTVAFLLAHSAIRDTLPTEQDMQNPLANLCTAYWSDFGVSSTAPSGLHCWTAPARHTGLIGMSPSPRPRSSRAGSARLHGA